MAQALLSLLLADLGRDALKFAAGLALALVIALAFTVSSLAALFGTVPPSAPPGFTKDNPSLPAPSASRVVDLARSEIGMPYVWGGDSPATSFDCSGLVQWVYRQVGIDLPRTAQEQYDATRRLGPAELRPGDLVYFASTYPSSDWITHVGIYVGNGQMIDAPNEGDVVREMPVFVGYWGAHYAGAGRVVR